MNAHPGRDPLSEDRHESWAARGPRTYYQRAGVSVTDRYLTVGGRRYEIAELYDVWTVRGPRDSLGSGAIVVAMVVLAIAIGWSYYGRSIVSASLVAVSLVTVGLAVTVWKTRRRHYELWADYYGVDIRVLTVLDSETYGQICRAIIRAREARDIAPAVGWRGTPSPSPVF